MENTTTFRLDFMPHDVIRRTPKAAMSYIPPDGTMMLTSTYAEDYKQHPMRNLPVHKPTEKNCLQTTKMVPMSLYKAEFKPWCVERHQPFKTTANLKLSLGKFANTTTFKEDYYPKSLTSPKRNFKPIPQKTKSMPFDGTTNYKLHFVTHPLQSRQLRTEKYTPPSASFCGMSTYKQDFKGLPSKEPVPIKANVAWKSNCTSFQDSTEFRDQYKPWSLQPNQSHRAENYRAPVGNTAFLSTTHADYVAHKYQHIQRVRPPIHVWVKDKEPFKGMSVMKEDYQPWDVAHQPSIMHVPKTAKPLEPYEKTTFSYHYRHKARDHLKACMSRCIQNIEPMLKDSITDTGKPLNLCPALVAQSPGFEHPCTKAGHKPSHSLGEVSLDQETFSKELMFSLRQKNCPSSIKDRRGH